MKEVADELTPEELATFEEYPDVDRPQTRADCWDFANDKPIGIRPCPFVTCRYNNYLTVTKHGRIVLTWPDIAPEDVRPEHSCALDVAEKFENLWLPVRGDNAPKEGLSAIELEPILGLTKSGVEAATKEAQASARKIRSRILKVLK